MLDLRKGDCFELMRTLDDNSVDLIVTDPPYDVHTDPGKCKNDLMRSIKNMGNDLIEHTDITKGYDIETFGNEALRIMKNINIYFWCNKKQIIDYLDFWVKGQGCKYDILFWKKSNPMPTYNKKYMTDVEYCLYFHKNAYLQPECYDDASLCFFGGINIKDKNDFGHPTIKPIEMMERLVRNSSKVGDVVLDPFMGSGTTGAAAIKNNRSFIGFEIDDHFFEIAEKRIMGCVGVDYKKTLF